MKMNNLSIQLALAATLVCTAIAPANAGAADDAVLDKELEQISSEVKNLDHLFPAKGISSADAAETALDQSQQLQNRLNVWANGAERYCYKTFFVNDCIKGVKLHRRENLPILQRISVEAKALQRQLRVMERDKELAQKQAQ